MRTYPTRVLTTVLACASLVGLAFFLGPTASAQKVRSRTMVFIATGDVNGDGVADVHETGTLTTNGPVAMAMSPLAPELCGEAILTSAGFGLSEQDRNTNGIIGILIGMVHSHPGKAFRVELDLMPQGASWSGTQIVSIYPASAVTGLAEPTVPAECTTSFSLNFEEVKVP